MDPQQMNHTPLATEWEHHVAQVMASQGQDPQQPAPPAKKQQYISTHPEAAPILVDANNNGIDDSLEAGGEEAPTEELAPLEEAKEHEIKDEEVKQHVEEKPENIKLPPVLLQHGLKAVETTTFPNYQNVKLPIPDEKVLMGQKAPVSSSLRWLSTFASYVLWRAHITLKTVHGRVVRVVKRK